MLRPIAYGMGLLFSGFATLFSLLVYGGKYLEEYLQGYPQLALQWNELCFLAALVMPPLVTFVAILCGWRRDRRHIQHLERELQELERTNHDLGLKLLSAQTPMRTPHTR